MKKTLLLSSLLTSSLLLASDLNIKSNEWNLIGTTENLDINKLALSSGDALWNYKNGSWYCYVKDVQTKYNPLNSLEAGDAFWVRSSKDINLNLNDTSTQKNVVDGWNMITSTSSEIDIAEYAQTNGVTFAFAYDSGSWSAYSKNGATQKAGFTPLTTIKPTQGVWVYKEPLNKIYFGDEATGIINGNFETIQKSTNDDVEDIWNISFEIDTSKDYNDFEIGIEFFKRESDGIITKDDDTDDEGEFVYKDLNLTNGVLSNPTLIDIYGVGDSGKGGTYFSSSYKPEMLTSSIKLNGNMLTLKLGEIMKNQTSASESTFKVIEDYDITITSNAPIIKNSKPINTNIITEHLKTHIYDFSNSNGIEGRIEIR
ncbi:MAG: hypothetical protein JXQ66_01910 [Campylobacterales bacterium]|nr:hypothetical protein [Campylobacterales bacterium]